MHALIGGQANDWFGGSVDEVKVYGAALSAADVTQLYNGGN